MAAAALWESIKWKAGEFQISAVSMLHSKECYK